MTDDDKQFATLAAEFALAGHALVRGAATDNSTPFYVMRWGWIKPLKSLDEARSFLKQIGGKQ